MAPLSTTLLTQTIAGTVSRGSGRILPVGTKIRTWTKSLYPPVSNIRDASASEEYGVQVKEAVWTASTRLKLFAAGALVFVILNSIGIEFQIVRAALALLVGALLAIGVLSIFVFQGEENFPQDTADDSNSNSEPILS